MPSHLSTIGLPVASQDDCNALIDQVSPDTTPLETPHGTYWVWSSECGAQLWLQADTENELIGFMPGFAGLSRVRVRLTKRIVHPDSTPLEGAFYAWADPTPDAPDSGAYPFVFDSLDFACHETLTLPTIAEAQIAAFAHEITVYPSVAAYDAAQTGTLKYASQSFVPSGLFTPNGEDPQPPNPFAIFTGHVLATELRTNPLTGATFYWAHVETLGGSFDVVADPVLCEQSPVVGGVLQGSFWLCGQLY